MNRIPQVFVTQHVLTKGIETYRDVLHSPGRTGAGSVRVSQYIVIVAPHWHATLEEAVERAEVVRQDAIAATKRRLGKLEALKIQVVEGDVEE